MADFLQHWLVPILLVVPVAVGLFVVGSRLDPGSPRPVERRTRPADIDTASPVEPEAPAPAAARSARARSTSRVEPTLH